MSKFEGLIMFAAYFSSSLVLLVLFVRLYLWVTPYDDVKEISKGNIAPAIALTGAMLGFTFPLLIASYSHSAFVGFIVWSVIACLVQLAVFGAPHRPRPVYRFKRGGSARWRSVTASVQYHAPRV